MKLKRFLSLAALLTFSMLLLQPVQARPPKRLPSGGSGSVSASTNNPDPNGSPDEEEEEEEEESNENDILDDSVAQPSLSQAPISPMPPPQANSANNDKAVKKVKAIPAPVPTTPFESIKIADEIDVKYTKSTGLSCLPRYLADAKKHNDEIMCEEPIFFRSDVVLSGNEEKHPKLYLGWLTISQGNVVFENLDIRGKIQVTANANVTFKNCKIDCTNIARNSEVGVEILAASSGVFDKCTLQGGTKVCVAVRDRSKAAFLDCTVMDAGNAAILATGCNISPNSQNTKLPQLIQSEEPYPIQLKGCKFFSCERFALYLHKNSRASVEKCQFLDSNGKAVFVLDNCEAKIKDSVFNKCKGGAVACAQASTVNVSCCDFSDIGSSALHGMAQSELFVSHCGFKNINGNGVNYEDSKGTLDNCVFKSETSFPDIAVFGQNGTPKISSCTIEKEPGHEDCIVFTRNKRPISTQVSSKPPHDGFMIVIRDGAKPTLENITIKGFSSKSTIISCSDFSEPTINNIKLEDSDKSSYIARYDLDSGRLTDGEFKKDNSKSLPHFMVYNKAVIHGNPVPDRKFVLLDYAGSASYHSMLDNESFMEKFDPSKCVVVEQKVMGKLKLEGNVDKDACEEIPLTPKNFCSQSLNVQFTKLLEDDDATKSHEKFIFGRCGHVVNVCPQCGNLCGHEDSPKEFKRSCDKCQSVFLTERKCPVCSIPFGDFSNGSGIIRVFDQCTEDSNSCLVCYSEPVSCIFSCGHKCTCYECARGCMKNKKCPFGCKVSGFKHDFFPFTE